MNSMLRLLLFRQDFHRDQAILRHLKVVESQGQNLMLVKNRPLAMGTRCLKKKKEVLKHYCKNNCLKRFKQIIECLIVSQFIIVGERKKKKKGKILMNFSL